MAKTRWTVLTYIAAHNNLADLGSVSRDQIQSVGSTADVAHGVLYDAPDQATRYRIGPSGAFEDEKVFDSFDSGDPDALIETAQWLFSTHPADRYALVLWSHGTGWMPSEIAAIANEARDGAAEPGEAAERGAAPGAMAFFRTTLRAMQRPPQRAERAILFDDGTGHSLDTLELARVTQTISAAIGQKIDLLGMDACLMANLEVAYEIRNSVGAFAASQELVPGHSWPYAAIYADLAANPLQTGKDLSKVVVEDYFSFYNQRPPRVGDVTKIAVDLENLETLAASVRNLADALLADMPGHAPVLWAAQRSTQDVETSNGRRSPNKFDFHLWDIRTIASRLAAADKSSTAVQAAAAALVNAFVPGPAILAERHRGAWFDGIGGLSVYMMPPGKQRLSPDYAGLAFPQRTRWLEMLRAYHKALI